jgi:hypothetical protein
MRCSCAIWPRAAASSLAGTTDSPAWTASSALALETRLREKSDICTKLDGPVWLALLNDYPLAETDTYTAVCRQLRLKHCFERIFLISKQGDVTELMIAA